MSSLPNCPQCTSQYTCQDDLMFVGPGSGAVHILGIEQLDIYRARQGPPCLNGCRWQVAIMMTAEVSLAEAVW